MVFVHLIISLTYDLVKNTSPQLDVWKGHWLHKNVDIGLRAQKGKEAGEKRGFENLALFAGQTELRFNIGIIIRL